MLCNNVLVIVMFMVLHNVCTDINSWSKLSYANLVKMTALPEVINTLYMYRYMDHDCFPGKGFSIVLLERLLNDGKSCINTAMAF